MDVLPDSLLVIKLGGPAIFLPRGFPTGPLKFRKSVLLVLNKVIVSFSLS
jgi:hypothetical protein